MNKVVVIGAGASGMVAAIKASYNNSVVLLDSNTKCGKKLLLTGNGRCNYWNSDICVNNYNTDNISNLNKILENKDLVLEFLTNLGLYPKIKNGYYYPNSNQASSVCEILCKELENRNVNILYNCKVSNITKINDNFVIKSNLDDIVCDKVIVATGGMSYPKTGSDGIGYKILEKYHTINKTLPALVPLTVEGNFLKDWNNLRVDAKLSLYINDNLIDIETGEVQLTDYGISGIPTFNLSSKVVRNLNTDNSVNIHIDFLPEVSDVYSFLNNRNKDNSTIESIFESVLPYQLVFVLLDKASINKDDKWNNISDESKNKLISLIKEFNLNITGYLDFDRSQVTTGGISLSEIDPNTMESLKVKDLYIVGELLDVDGKCGGFNLAFSFITGYLAGSSLC